MRLQARVLTCIVMLIAAGCGGTSQPPLCEQAEMLLEPDAISPPPPKHWGDMTLAGARLLYVSRECGDRVTETREQLCAAHREAIIAFAENPSVRKREGRAEALHQNLRVYNNAGCQPTLDVD